MAFQHSLLLLWMYVCVSKERLLAWLSLRVPLTSPCTPEHYSPHNKTHQSWYGFGLAASGPPSCLCATYLYHRCYFLCFLHHFPFHFLKGKVPPGCNLGPSSHLVPTHCEFWPHCIEGRLIRPSVVNWPHTLLIIANSLACFSFFCPFSVTFFLHVTRGAVFGISFHGSSFCFSRVDVGRHMQKSTGGIAKGRDRKGEIKVCQINSSLCESAYHHRERQWKHPPRHKKMSSKCWHYRQCHLFLNRDPSTGLCHPPIKVHYWSIYKEVYTLLNSTVKY